MQRTLGSHPGQRLNIGIAGAGLLGRLLAWNLAHQGHQVSVFDPASGPQPSFDGQGAAGFTAAGMLSPLAELETAEPDVAERGWYAITRWAEIRADLARRLPAPPHFAREGSLMVAHGPDLGAARRVLARLVDGTASPSSTEAQPQALDMAALAQLEPSLHSTMGRLHAWLLAGEAPVDTVRPWQRLHGDARAVTWHGAQAVSNINPGQLDGQPFS